MRPCFSILLRTLLIRDDNIESGLWLHCTNGGSVNHNSCCTLVIRKMYRCNIVYKSLESPITALNFMAPVQFVLVWTKQKKSLFKKKKNLIKEQSKIFVMKFFQDFWGIPKTTACSLLNNCLINQDWLEDCNPTNRTFWLSDYELGIYWISDQNRK